MVDAWGLERRPKIYSYIIFVPNETGRKKMLDSEGVGGHEKKKYIYNTI